MSPYYYYYYYYYHYYHYYHHYYYYYYYFYYLTCPSPSFSSDKQYWSHQCDVLRSEMKGDVTLKEALVKLQEIEEAVVVAVERSKARDDERGRVIIDDYDDTHVVAQDDGLVKRVKSQFKGLEARVLEALQLPQAHTLISDLLSSS